MRSIIFNDSGKLELLNSLVHPIMRKETKKWFDEQSTQYAIKEAALIVETNTLVDLDELILVESPIAIRMKRLGIRDHLCPEEIKQRMKSQLPEEEKKKYATQIIVNDEKMLLIPQILALHTLFLEKARS